MQHRSTLALLALAVGSGAVYACAQAALPTYPEPDASTADGCTANLQTDPKNCGACGNACGTGEVCTQGKCDVKCGPNETKCGASCVDLTKDKANCGACGNACGMGLECRNVTGIDAGAPPEAGVGGFACAPNCSTPQVICGAKCADLAADPQNCQSCGKACPMVANGQAVCGGDAGADGGCGFVCNQGFFDCDKDAGSGCESMMQCQTRTIPNFTGQLGPDYSSEGFMQCVGYLDTTAANEIPDNGWATPCKVLNTTRVRFACGANAQTVRFVDLSRNVFNQPLTAFPETGLIVNANFMGYTNDVYAQGNDLNLQRSWIGGGQGCGESNTNLTINNSCTYEASNCFGQNVAGNRYLYVYVK